MRREYAAGCAMGLLLLLAGCSGTPTPPPDTSAADLKAIKDGEIAWSADFGSKDPDKIVSHYADDATLMMPDAPIIMGKDAIRSAVADMMSDKNRVLSFTTANAQVAKGGDIAYTQGTYSMTMTNPKTKKPVTEKGKYLTVYKKQSDGTWKAIEDIINADALATPVAMAAAKRSAPVAGKKKRKKA
jgi:ketosteroid isomerase-like protein